MDLPPTYQDWIGQRVLVRAYGQPGRPKVWWAGTVARVRRWRLHPPKDGGPGASGESPMLVLVQPLRGRGSQWIRPCRLELVQDWPTHPQLPIIPAALGDSAIPDLWHQHQAVARRRKARLAAKRQAYLGQARQTQRTPPPTSGAREIVSGL
jgi:hypothetical protein